MLIASAQGAADRHDVSLTAESSDEALLQTCRDNGAMLVVIDLRTPGLAITQLIPRLRESLPTEAVITACAPHVHTQSLTAAAAAGCDAVITRGEFERRIEAHLAQLTGG